MNEFVYFYGLSNIIHQLGVVVITRLSPVLRINYYYQPRS